MRLSLAEVFQETGRDEDALEELGRVLEVQPNSDDAYRLTALILSTQGKTDEAIAQLDL